MLPFFALVLPVLLLFCGLPLDIGMAESRRLTMQHAADAAALAAELEVERGTGGAVGVGMQTAALNGFTNGANNTTVTIAMRPSAGTYAGNFDALQVTITQPAKTLFLSAVTGTATVATGSVALVPPCVYLNGSAAGTAALTGQNASLSFGCPLYASGNIALDTQSTLSATAENLTPSATLSGGGTVAPAPRLNAARMADPLAAVPQPAFTACTSTGFAKSGGTATLNPGVFCKGLTLTNTNVTLQPGLYIITGGARWSGATVRGSGVTLFFTQGGGAGFGQFRIDNGSNITLAAAPNSSQGAVPGVLVFADRNWTATATQDLQIINATVHGDGIWYSTGTGLLLSGSTLRGDRYLAFDMDTLSATSSTVAAAGDFSSIPGGSPFRPAGGLVE